MQFEIIENDVRGNQKEGYWINKAFHTDRFIELSEKDLYYDDTSLKRKVKKAFCIKPGIHLKHIDVDGDPDFALHVNVKSYPLGELVPVK